MISDKGSVCKPRVMLINPPQTVYEGSKYFSIDFPIGILSVATTVKGKCHLKIFDCLVEKFQETKNEESITYGTPLKNIRNEIKNFNPDIVGISCLFSCQLPNSVEIANLCKTIDPKILIVLGGPDASIRGKFILSHYSSIDICVVGEGEETFLEIIKKFKNGHLNQLQTIKGIIYRKGERVIRNKNRGYIQNLDKLPFPAYELIDFKKYFNHPHLYAKRSFLNKKSISMITSRGCPFNCIFCSAPLHMGKAFRVHSPEYVLNHIKLLTRKYGIKNIHFEDDNMSLDVRRFAEILDGIIENNLNINWDSLTGFRADTLSFDLLRKAKRAGCKRLVIGVESGNQKILNKIVKKNLNLEHVVKVVKWCYKLKIDLSAFYLIGFPGEKIENIKETINFALLLYKEYSVYPFLSIATPLYGTELYDICEKNSYFSCPIGEKEISQGMQIYGKHLIETEDFEGKDIDRLVRYFEKRLFERLLLKKQLV